MTEPALIPWKASDLDRVAAALLQFMPMMHGNQRRQVSQKAAFAALAALEDKCPM